MTNQQYAENVWRQQWAEKRGIYDGNYINKKKWAFKHGNVDNVPEMPYAQSYTCVNLHTHLYSVDLELWSKLAESVCIKRTALKCALDFDCDW